MDLWIIAFLVFVIIGAVFFIRSRTKKLSAVELRQALRELEPSLTLAPEHSMLELHKIFVHKLNYLQKKNLKAAAIISVFAKRFPNEKEVWYFHRLRNQVAHQPNFKASKQQAEQAYLTYKQALESLSR